MNENELEVKLEQANKKIDKLLAIMEAQQGLIAKNAIDIQKQEQRINKYRREMADLAQNVRYELHGSKELLEGYWFPKIMDQSLTLKQMIEQKRSFVRFTETELDMMVRFLDDEPGQAKDSKEQLNYELKKRLQQILLEDNERCIVAVPDFFGPLDVYKSSVRRRFRSYMTPERRRDFMEILPQHKNYHDANMIHPDEYDEMRTLILNKERFKKLIPLWADKKIVAVTAPGTGLSKDNPYFKAAKDFVAMEVPVTHALESYKSIYEECLKHQAYDVIYLVGAGPMGVALAADLCKAGSQAVDVGTLGKRYLDYQNPNGGKK